MISGRKSNFPLLLSTQNCGLMFCAALWAQEEEQAALDDEAERRRKRVQAWQEQKAKQMAEEEQAVKDAAEEAVQWTFEDDSDEVRSCDLLVPCLTCLPPHIIVASWR